MNVPIENSELQADFGCQKILVAKKRGWEEALGGNKNDRRWANVQIGFHAMKGGPGELEKIYAQGREHGGFDFRLGREGAYGRGSYFAHHAIYSAYLFPRPTPAADGSITLIFAEIILGESKDYERTRAGDLVRPPAIDGQPGKTYDSVQGTEEGFGIHDAIGRVPSGDVTFRTHRRASQCQVVFEI